EDATQDGDRADDDRGDAGDPHLLLLRRLAVLEDLLVEVVREALGGGDGETRDHREDRGERDTRDDTEQHRPAELVGEQRRSRVRLARSGLYGLRAHEGTDAA